MAEAIAYEVFNVETANFGTDQPKSVTSIPYVKAQTLTLRELIERKVIVEVMPIKEQTDEQRRTAKEDPARFAWERLRSTRNKGKVSYEIGPEIVIEKEVQKALGAFQANRYSVFVNGKQITDLDETLDLDKTDRVVFLNILQLRGG